MSEFFAGSVGVGVFLVESTGSAYDWSDTEVNQTLDGIYAGLAWWASQEPKAHLSFSYELHVRQSTSYEPIQDSLDNDTLWINEVMGSLGYGEADPWSRSVHYNNDLRMRLGTDWAFSIFVADSDAAVNMGRFTNNQYAHAYYGGPWETMSRYSTWAYNWPNYYSAVPAHETGHIFYATDEYDSYPVQYSGYFDCPDQNGAPGIMNQNEFSVHSTTRCQLGWVDADSDGILDELAVPPETTLVPHAPNPTRETSIAYDGSATVVPLPNRNPIGPGNDVTISRLTRVEFRIDAGPWEPALAVDGAFDDFVEPYRFVTSSLSAGVHVIQARAGNTEGRSDTSPAADPITVLQSLVVDAGPDQTTTEGVSVTFSGSASAGQPDLLNWTREPGIRVDIGGTYDASAAFHPAVLSVPGGFRMYYAGSTGGVWRILSATSADQLSWTKEPGIRVNVGTSCDSSYAYHASIVTLANGTYRMYYAGFGGPWCILSAWSVDGLAWAKEPGIRVSPGGPYDSDGAFSPFVMATPGGDWRMYYSGAASSVYRILSATSADGLAWTKELGIRVDRGGTYESAFVDSANVVPLSGGTFRMFYHGYDGTRSRILSAVSADGLTWAKESGVRIDAGGVNESVTVGYPYVVPAPSGGYRMFYAGSDGSSLRILSAVAAPTAVTAWWDFDVTVDTSGDSVPDNDVDATGLQATHAYLDDGTYEAKLCASAGNETGCDFTNTTVRNVAPTVTVVPSAANESDAVVVRVAAVDQGSDDLTVSWFWQFGTGGSLTSYNNGVSPDPSHSSAGTAPFYLNTTISHVYDDDAVFILNVNVSDDDGGTVAYVALVSVGNSNPVLLSAIGPLDVPLGSSRQYQASASDPGSDDLLLNWSWGDGKFSSSVYYNNGASPDGSPSPDGTAPFAIMDTQNHTWGLTGPYSVVVRVEDDDGGVAQTSFVVRVHALPTADIVIGLPYYMAAEEFVNASTDLTFTATDNSGFGIDRIEFRVDGGAWTVYDPGSPLHLVDEGLHFAEFRSFDAIGGVSSVGNRSLVVDNSAPVVSIVAGSPSHTSGDTWVRSTTTIALSAADRGLVPVGVGTLQYRVWSGTWTQWVPYALPFTLAGEGRHFVEARSADFLGNPSAGNTSYVVDDTPPATEVEISGLSYQGAKTYVRANTTVILAASDGGTIPAGVERTEFRFDLEAAWRPYSGSISLTNLSQGDHVVYYRSSDWLGNQESEGLLSFYLDEAPPTSVLAATASSAQTRTANISSTDLGCGVARVDYSLDGGTWRLYGGDFVVSGYGNHTVRYRATDCVGNVEAERVAYVLIPEPEANLKPVVAIVFLIVLLLSGLLLRRRPIDPGDRRKLLAVTVAFVAMEAATGVLSLLTGWLSVPPLLGPGLVVDVLILVAGIATVVLLSRKSEAPLPPPED